MKTYYCRQLLCFAASSLMLCVICSISYAANVTRAELSKYGTYPVSSRGLDRNEENIFGLVRTVELSHTDNGSVILLRKNTYDVPGNQIEHISYNKKGEISWIGRITHDSRGNHLEDETYDRKGFLTGKTSSRYNKHGNKLDETWNDNYNNKQTSSVHTYIYDTDGSLKMVKCGISLEKKLFYNTVKRTIKELLFYSDKPGKVSGTNLVTFDLSGRPVKNESYAADGSLEDTWTYAYDANGKAVSLTMSSPGWIDKTNYDSDGNVSTEIYSIEGPKDLHSDNYEYVYDTHNNWVKKTRVHDGVPTGIEYRRFTYYD
ncbi:MAG: hypothetical protein NT018_08375 [Armatimonadetes bacterium]|nr:hypothetical protein [Armatimonadota bacterium]